MRERVYISSNNMATFICPSCTTTRHLNVSKILGSKKEVHIKCKCKCGNMFKATLERRRFYRKDINLNGICYLGKENHKLSVLVRDISRSGLKIKLNSPHHIKLGDELLVEFNLDNQEQSFISKKVVVRSVSDLNLGVEFKSPEHYDKLGSYLMFQ